MPRGMYARTEVTRKSISNGMKRAYDEGRKVCPWKGKPSPNKGKHLSPSTKIKLSASIKKTFAIPEVRNKLIARNREVAKRPEVKAKIKERLNSLEVRIKSKLHQIEHKNAVERQCKVLRKQGFYVINNDLIRPDLIARKGNLIYAVEVEFSDRPDYLKYKGQSVYDDVIWVSKRHRKEKI